MNMIGYARVSTSDQNLDLQLNGLKRAGCDEIHQDMISGTKYTRDGLQAALDALKEGDTLVVYKLDRLGRSTLKTLELIQALENRGVTFKSLTESIDTSTPFGKMSLTVLAAVAQLERDIIAERTKAGLRAAQARGVVLGAPQTHGDNVIEKVKVLIRAGYKTQAACDEVGISRAQYYRRK